MSLNAGYQLQCVDTCCPPFDTFGASNIRRCQMACLARDHCQAASFHRSTSTCQLFSKILDQGGVLTADVDTTVMFVIYGTRIPFGKCEIEDSLRMKSSKICEIGSFDDETIFQLNEGKEKENCRQGTFDASLRSKRDVT